MELRLFNDGRAGMHLDGAMVVQRKKVEVLVQVLRIGGGDGSLNGIVMAVEG